jgi:hypothetical protein
LLPAFWTQPHESLENHDGPKVGLLACAAPLTRGVEDLRTFLEGRRRRRRKGSGSSAGD